MNQKQKLLELIDQYAEARHIQGHSTYNIKTAAARREVEDELERALSDEDLQQLPKGRHALVIAGTYGIDGYVAAPQQEAQEPYAYAVYFPDQPKVELVHELDDLVDDLTNRPHVVTKLYAAPQPSTTAQTDSVPAIQGEMNVQLDIDSNHSAPGQQRDVARSVALGQPMGNGQDQAAGRPSAQGDKLLTVAERNIRSFLRSATFKSESDREAALNCVDVLWEAARATADSVTAPAAAALHQIMAAAKELHAIDNPDAEPAEWAALRQCEVDVWRARAERVLKAATPPAPAADSVLEDAARWQWLADYLIGERTDLDEGIVACATIDALRQFADAARKQGASHDR